MTVEEKLQHFYDVAVGEARKEADDMLEEHRQALAAQLDAHREEKLRQAQDDIRAEIDHAKREVNKTLSAEQLLIKRNWTKRQNELKERLFEEIKEKLEAFMASPEYEAYLAEKIHKAKAIAGDSTLEVFVTSKDAPRVPALTAKCGLPIQVSEEPFMGGIKAVLPEKNILIDNSFLDAFVTLKKEFKFDGGLHHE